MWQKGMHSKLNMGEAKPTSDSFVENYKKMKQLQQQIADLLKPGEPKGSMKSRGLRFRENYKKIF